MKVDIHILMIGMLFFLIVLCFVGLIVHPGDKDLMHFLDLLVVAFLTKFTNGFGRYHKGEGEGEKGEDDAGEPTGEGVRVSDGPGGSYPGGRPGRGV